MLALNPEASLLRLVTDGADGESACDLTHVADVAQPMPDDEEDEYVALERDGIQQFGS